MAEHMAELPVNTVNESNASGKVEQRRYIVTSSTMSEAQVALYVYNPVKRLSWCSRCITWMQNPAEHEVTEWNSLFHFSYICFYVLFYLNLFV